MEQAPNLLAKYIEKFLVKESFGIASYVLENQ